MSDLPYDREHRAAEYVLGVLPVGEARLVEREMLHDPQLAQAVSRWEQRLAPLASTIQPVTPPAEVWARIESDLGFEHADVTAASAEAAPMATEEAAPADIEEPPAVIVEPPRPKPVEGLPPWIAQRPERPAGHSPVVTIPPRGLWHNTGFWRGTAMGGLALAAVLAFFAIVRAPAPAGFHGAIVALERPGSMWMAETMPDGRIKLTAMTAIDRPPNRDLELWALPKGAAKPIPMGVIPASGVMMVAGHDMPMDGLQLLVSLEPMGGSPTGAPTGPVMYGGTLHPANPV